MIADDPPPAELDNVEQAINGQPDPVRVHAILTSNDDGSQAPTVTPTEIWIALANARPILAAANITITFDPNSDVSRMNSTLLNHDCTVAPGTNLNTGSKDIVPPQECNLHAEERDRVARLFPGKLVMYFSSGDTLQWNKSAASWFYGPRGFHWSNHTNQFVAMANGAQDGSVMAHEMGHYFHLGHTFYAWPTTAAEARNMISQYVSNVGGDKTRGLEVFDADGLADTPPDPGPDLFVAAGLNPCNVNDGTLLLGVFFGSPQQYVYAITPDRENLMSYWNKTCRGSPPHLSASQIARIRNALENANPPGAASRKHLVDPKVLHGAVWEAGARTQKRALEYVFGDIANRMRNEIGAGGHVAHLQAYDIGGSQIRWDAVWELGATDQSWILGWTLADFIQQQQTELARGRHLVHMQAYDFGGGQIRYDAIWEPGSTSQTWVAGSSVRGFVTTFDQRSRREHLVHMQAYLVAGSIRYDAVWEPDARGTTRALGLTQSAFDARFDTEQSTGRRLVHMQAYDLGGGQLRWDGVWEDGASFLTHAVGLGFNDFVSRSHNEAFDGRHLVHMQAYDIGDGTGQVRYDGVWDLAGSPTQHRILSESAEPFGSRFDAERTAGFHIVMMQAHTGR